MLKRIANTIIDMYIFPITKLMKINKYILKKIHISCIKRSINLARQNIKDNMCIVDVGAYLGEQGDTTQVFAEAFPSNRVFAFEPFMKNYNVLVKNTKKHTNVKPFCLALSDEERKGTLYVTAASSSSSLLEVNFDEVNKLKKQYSRAIKQVKEESIEITTLDKFAEKEGISEIAILKIDTQGTELSVLKGARKILNKTALIMFENNNHQSYNNAKKYYEVDEYLRENGFELFDIVPSLYEKGRIYEWDAIYVNSAYKEFISKDDVYDGILPF